MLMNCFVFFCILDRCFLDKYLIEDPVMLSLVDYAAPEGGL